MDFAIIETGGKQYCVSSGEELKVEKITAKSGEKMSFDKVLLVKDGETIQIGQPYLEGVKIETEVVGQEKDKKIRVARFRAKSRYRRVIGHRQRLTKVKITSAKKQPSSKKSSTKKDE